MVSVHPNAGLPNDLGEYDDTPENMAKVLGEMVDAGWLNVVGGCCGTEPAHIEAIADRAKDANARKNRVRRRDFIVSGLEPHSLERGESIPQHRRTNERNGFSAIQTLNQERQIRRSD